MSLDVYLTTKHKVTVEADSGIFVRIDGATREISREEWNARNPDRQVPILDGGELSETNTHYSANITHNLGGMAEAAGIYTALWRPDEIGISKASQLIKPLKAGLALLRADPQRFEVHNAPNGWGMYKHFVPFVAEYLAACEEYPDAEVSVSR